MQNTSEKEVVESPGLRKEVGYALTKLDEFIKCKIKVVEEGIEYVQDQNKFRSKAAPQISVHEYLLRINKYCPLELVVVLSITIYFERLAARGTIVLDKLSVHRLLVAALVVSSKLNSDVFYTNTRYAKVGGLPPNELARLELAFLLALDFELFLSPEELLRAARLLDCPESCLPFTCLSN
ncbi:hypothetical protein BB561_006293 [Smittium simulii]|uniref:Cyclin n=1 Tax=Smittium simulii TaxID=133385 RepID=A0A2T9Y5F9_9FUNG|nr:hypothetical protein BB561_006293 [Smittium simulii]